MAKPVQLTVNNKAFLKALDNFYRGTEKDRSDALLRYGRLACVSLAMQTQPFGTDKGVRDKAQENIKREIGRVYVPVPAMHDRIQRTGKTFSDVPNVRTAAQAGAAFIRMIRRGDKPGAEKLLQDLKIERHFTTRVGSMDSGAEHRGARHGSRRKVPRNTFTKLAVTNFNKLTSYARKVVQRVGTAKAGWSACANQLGGTRGIPSWVNKQAQGKGLGVVDNQSRRGSRPFVLMTNRVPWIDKCLSPRQVQRALDIQRQKMVLAINRQMSTRARASNL